ncbi:hypothetical protein Tco_0769243 [Tanacetum coccineum]|uniref:Reverse transcriptase domain-containing protein n=1 Tax=Tanacetum coccineum TaxID=301880 RepID=A0ABQ4ZCA0_9ASTR
MPMESTAISTTEAEFIAMLMMICSNPLVRSQLKTKAFCSIKIPCTSNRVLERQKKLRNQIFRALTASADIPSSVTETTDTTSTLQPPPPPLQKPTVHRDICYKDGKVRSKCENKGIVRLDGASTGNIPNKVLVMKFEHPSDTKDHLKMEMEMEIPSVKASANSDIIFFFTSAQDGNRLLDDERLSLADDLKKAHDQNQNKVHNTFHISNLKKCYSNEPLAVPFEGLHIDDKLQFVEEPVEIMEREVKRLKQSRIPLIKVRWNSKRGPEFTLEREDSFKKKYPHLFTNRVSSSSTMS